MITNLIISAYCLCSNCCPAFMGGYTASGLKPKEGVTIAAGNSIPMWSRVKLPGLGVRIVQDRMHRRFDGKRLDVFVSNHKRAKDWGVRMMKVEIMPPKSKKKSQR